MFLLRLSGRDNHIHVGIFRSYNDVSKPHRAVSFIRVLILTSGSDVNIDAALRGKVNVDVDAPFCIGINVYIRFSVSIGIFIDVWFAISVSI